MLRLISLLAMALLIGGCADSYQLILNNNSSLKLAPTDSVFIGIPSDGAYGSRTYRSSGQDTARIILSAFAKHIRDVRLGRSTEDFDSALASARAAHSTYLVFPTILHWEDRATEWSAIPDKVEVKVEVVDTVTTAVATSVIIKGKSGLATLGGDHPQDLLPQPIDKFVSSLY